MKFYKRARARPGAAFSEISFAAFTLQFLILTMSLLTEIRNVRRVNGKILAD